MICYVATAVAIFVATSGTANGRGMRGEFNISTNKVMAIKLARLRAFVAPPDDPTEYYPDCAAYKHFMREIGMLLAYEVAKDLTTMDVRFDTPRGEATGKRLSGNYSVVVPILRTGLILAEGFQTVLSHTHTGHIGLHKDKDHPEAGLIEYLVVLPNPDPPTRLFIVLDSVVATGETADRAINLIKEHGATNISFGSVVTSRLARDRLTKAHPDVRFYAAAVDEELDAAGRVVPGLGSVSELLFGFRTATVG